MRSTSGQGAEIVENLGGEQHVTGDGPAINRTGLGVHAGRKREELRCTQAEHGRGDKRRDAAFTIVRIRKKRQQCGYDPDLGGATVHRGSARDHAWHARPADGIGVDVRLRKARHENDHLAWLEPLGITQVRKALRYRGRLDGGAVIRGSPHSENGLTPRCLRRDLASSLALTFPT